MESERWVLWFKRTDTNERAGVYPAGFPEFANWHRDGESAKREALRVLRILKGRGEREWMAGVHRDPLQEPGAHVWRLRVDQL